ncbi:Egg cell-secreted protein 1.4 [Citrus sinensis]|nr:Egg cell-secreted protein 1.4 [Citrus sinensis]
MALKHVFSILALTCLIMETIANATSRNDCLNNIMKPGYDLTTRFEASGGLTECWNTLMELKSCSNEIVVFFLNSQANIRPDYCRAIDIITRNCWPAMPKR